MTTTTSACSVLGPSCIDEQGPVLRTSGVVRVGDIATVTVRSPKSSNLIIRLQWDDTESTLALRATIIDCGGHIGCAMVTVTPTFGPSGPSPTPQPWPPGYREMLVDGWEGKTYKVEVVGASDRDVSYTLDVVYRIACES